MEGIYMFIVAFVVLLIFLPIYIYKIRKKSRSVQKNLSKYGLTVSDLTGYNCTYVGGHPGRNWEAKSVVVGAKHGKLIFFQGLLLNYHDDLTTRGTIAWEKDFRYLFDIQIDNIENIRYFDLTTSRTEAVIGGNYWAVPIRIKKEDADVLIDWRDGKYNHSTELRITGSASNARANALRNALLKMIK